MAENTRNADLDFAADLFKAADKMRGGLEPSEYKHVALGLIFLKYISEAFQAMHVRLSEDSLADPENPEEYLAENVFWVPETARWSHIQQNARSGNIGKIIDDSMEAIEVEPTNKTLKGVLPKNYARPTLDKTMLGELVDLFSNVKMHNLTAPIGRATCWAGSMNTSSRALPVPKASAGASSLPPPLRCPHAC